MKQNTAEAPKGLLSKISGGLRSFENVLLVICAVIFMCLMFLSAGDVIGRFFFNRPITGAYEISTMMMGAIVLLGWAYTQKEDGHVSVELFFDRFPSVMQKISSIITLVLALALFVTITIKSLEIAIANTVDGRTFQILDIPSGPFYFLVPVGGFFLCLELVIGLMQQFQKKGEKR